MGHPVYPLGAHRGVRSPSWVHLTHDTNIQGELSKTRIRKFVINILLVVLKKYLLVFAKLLIFLNFFLSILSRIFFRMTMTVKEHSQQLTTIQLTN